MNTEQAIKELEKCLSRIKEEFENGTSQQYLFAQAALGVCTDTNADCILAALRNQRDIKPPEPCEYCDFSSGDVGASIKNTGDNFLLIRSGDEVSIATDDQHFKMLSISFCPMCGRKLGCD